MQANPKFNPHNDVIFAGDMRMVKKFRTNKEKQRVKEFFFNLALSIASLAVLLVAYANDVVYLVPLCCFSLWYIKRLRDVYFRSEKTRKNGDKVQISEQRRRITNKMKQRDSHREYKQRISAINAQKEKEASEEAERLEELALDARLKAALEPIDFDKPEEFNGNWVKMNNPADVAPVKAQPKQEAPVEKSLKGQPSKKMKARKGSNVNKQAKKPVKRKPNKGFKKVNIEI